MRPAPFLFTTAFVGVLLACAYGQVPNLEPEFGLDTPVPTVSFEVAFPGVSAEHYVFAVDSSGSAAYRSDNIGTEGQRESALGEPYTLEFTISGATSARIFDLARQANYFKGKFSAVNGPVANASVTTLTYREGPPFSYQGLISNVVDNDTTYSFTTNPALQELARIFEGISNTLELGRRLEQQRQVDPSAVDTTLTRIGASACDHQLLELNAIQQSLQDVANDPAVTQVSRSARAAIASIGELPPATVGGLCQP